MRAASFAIALIAITALIFLTFRGEHSAFTDRKLRYKYGTYDHAGIEYKFVDEAPYLNTRPLAKADHIQFGNAFASPDNRYVYFPYSQNAMNAKRIDEMLGNDRLAEQIDDVYCCDTVMTKALTEQIQRAILRDSAPFRSVKEELYE